MNIYITVEHCRNILPYFFLFNHRLQQLTVKILMVTTDDT